MRAIVIAVLKENNKIWGYRLLRLPDKEGDTNNYAEDSMGEVINVPDFKVRFALRNKQIKIVNIRLTHDGIKGYGGSLDRYAQIDISTMSCICEKSPLILIKQLPSLDGYIIADCNGKIIKALSEYIIKYAEKFGIANGKIVEKDGKKYIAKIGDTVDKAVENTNRQQEKKISAKQNSGESIMKMMNISEFESYMQKRGLQYKLGYDKSTLISLDESLKSVAIPRGIKVVNDVSPGSQYFDVPRKTALEHIVFPNTYSYSTRNLFKDMVNLKSIGYEEGTTIVNLGEVDDGVLNNKNKYPRINFPYTIQTIVAYHTKDTGEVFDIDLSDLPNLRELDDCFRYVTLSNIDFGTTKVMHGCFGCVTYPGKIKFGKNIELITDSFTESNFTELDFSEAENLEEISGHSFRKLNSLRRVDLSHCKKLRRIGAYCFQDCPQLEEIKLPSSLTEIDNYSFSKCPKLTRVYPLDRVVKIGDDVFKDSMVESITVGRRLKIFKPSNSNLTVKTRDFDIVSEKLFYSIYLKKLQLNEGIRVIDSHGLGFTKAALKIPSTLQQVKRLSFNYFKVPDKGGLDFSNCKDLKVIEEKAFANSEINHIILPDGLEEIEQSCFQDASLLEWIYIPGSVTKIGRSAFFKAGTSIQMGCTIYTQRNSCADKLCKRNKINVEYVDSAEEVKKKKLNKTLEGEALRQFTKANMLLSLDENHQELLKDPYKEYAVDLYRLYVNTTEDSTENIDIELKTDGFVSVSMYELFNSIEVGRIHPIQGNEQSDNTLKAYINFITFFTQNYSYLLKPDIFEYMRKSDLLKSNEIMVLASADIGYIVRVRITMMHADMLLVILNNKVVYCTLYKFQSSAADVLSEIDFSKIGGTKKPVENTLANTKYKLIFGTKYNAPRYINYAVNQTQKEQWSLVGLKTIRYNLYGPNSNKAIVYMYSNKTQNVVKLMARILETTEIGESNIRAMSFLEYKNLYEIPEEWKEDIKKSSFIQDGIQGLIGKLFYHGEERYVEMLKGKEGAYDEPTTCFEWELSDQLQLLNIDELTKLNHKGIEIILKSPFFHEVRKSASILENCFAVYRADIENGLYQLTCYRINKNRFKDVPIMIGFRPEYITVLKDSLAPEKSTIQCYLSNISFKNIFETLYKLKNDNAVAEYTVDDKLSNYDDYCMLQPLVISMEPKGSSYINVDDIYTGLGINRKNGVIFLISHVTTRGEVYNKTYTYKIFRFRNFEEALKFMYALFIGELKDKKTGETISFLQAQIRDLVIDLYKGTDISKREQLYDIRREILEEYPNGYSNGVRHDMIFNLLAKQK